MSQSIALGSVSSVNFNGTSVDKVNLNGSAIWEGGTTVTVTNVQRSAAAGKINPAWTANGYIFYDPGNTMFNTEQSYSGSVSNGVNGKEIGALNWQTAMGLCSTGGILLGFRNAHSPESCFNKMVIDGETFLRSDAIYYDRWGWSTWSNVFAGAEHGTFFHWHNRGSNLFQGSTSTVVFT